MDHDKKKSGLDKNNIKIKTPKSHFHSTESI